METQEVADFLMQNGYAADALHGDLSQAQRDTVMKKFRLKNIDITVCYRRCCKRTRCRFFNSRYPFLYQTILKYLYTEAVELVEQEKMVYQLL